MDRIAALIRKLTARLAVPCERVIFPLALLLWPFVNVMQGVDVADGTYSLVNYAFQDGLDPMWLLATWLPNLLGSFLARLPFGGTMAGMNILCTFVIVATAEAAYFGLRGITDAAPASRQGSGMLSREEQVTGARRMIPSSLLFVGIWIAESLCWCPATILYNYLTYFFLTLAGVLLLRAFACPDDGSEDPAGQGGMIADGHNRIAGLRKLRREHWYLLAGLCLGLNLFVRFPNAVEALLILAVWLAEGKDLRRVLRATGRCLVGYITGVIIPLVIIMVAYGPTSYFGMIAGLFSMTEEARDYTLGGMLLSVLLAYCSTLMELLLAVPVLLTGFALFYLVTAGERGEMRGDGARELHWKRYRLLKILSLIAFAGLVLLLFRVYFSFGVFTRNYQYYDCFFEAGMMVLILAVIMSVVGMTRILYRGSFPRAASLLMLLLILITPIGSNNYTYPLMNNLFLVLPIFFRVLKDAVTALGERTAREPLDGPAGTRLPERQSAGRRGEWIAEEIRPFIAGGIRTTLLIWSAGLILFLAVQGALFHVYFAFGDGTDGRKRDAVIRDIPRARGMHTTAENAASLEELYGKLHGEYADAVDAAGGRAIIFGDAPGLHYLLELAPALFTAWPDLASNEIGRFDRALLDAADSGEYPLVILREDPAAYPDTAGFSAAEKADLLLDYLAETGYNKLFGVSITEGVQYTVYAR